MSEKRNRKFIKPRSQTANAVQNCSGFETPFETTNGENKVELDQNMMATMCNEMFKLLQDKFNCCSGSSSSGGAANFAGMQVNSHALTCSPSNDQFVSEWIINTGASDHVTPCSHLFITTRTLKRPVLITLSDGSTKSISIVEKIKLSLSLTLHHLLFVPDFKYNLLSVGKLLTITKIDSSFLH